MSSPTFVRAVAEIEEIMHDASLRAGLYINKGSKWFASRVPETVAIIKGRGIVFQRLDDLALLFAEHIGIDPRQSSAIDWTTLQQLLAARHAHVHADGRVDAKYLRAVPSSALKVGQQIVITEREARLAIKQASTLCDVLSAL